MMIRSVLAAGAAVASLALAPLAHADTDSDYLAALRRGGIAPMGDGSGELSNAHAICNQLRGGRSWQAVNDELYAAESQPPDPLTHSEVDYEENTAIQFYCPGLH